MQRLKQRADYLAAAAGVKVPVAPAGNPLTPKDTESANPPIRLSVTP